MARVDLVVVEGFQREPHRKIEVHRVANEKPLLFLDDPGIVGIVTDTTVETRLPIVHLDDIEAVAAMMLKRCAISLEDVLSKAKLRADQAMAQLSDDCFAFISPMMTVDEAVGLIATRVARCGCRDGHAGARRWPHPRARHFGAPAAAALHQFRRRWLMRSPAAICQSRKSMLHLFVGRLPLADLVDARVLSTSGNDSSVWIRSICLSTLPPSTMSVPSRPPCWWRW